MALTGTILSAKPLRSETIKKIEARYEQLLEQPVELSCFVDESLIGGVTVQIGDQIWDDSIRNMLFKLTKTVERTKSTEQSYREIFEHIQLLSAEGSQVDPNGVVISTGDGIANVKGLDHATYAEMIDFGNECFGIAMNLHEDYVSCILLGEEATVSEGGVAIGTGRVMEVPVGDGVIGRVIDPLGRPLDQLGPIATDKYRIIESMAAPIIDRQPVTKPLQTGWLAIDSMIPLGRGQRQLIIGDRQTGKTTLAVDTILNQKDQDVLCIYVAIGQKASTVAQLHKKLQDAGAMKYTTIVSSTASDSAPMQYIAPYAGCAIAEAFMYSGRDVLIVYDDLSKHAVAYRTISLLLKRPPGREAFPGDVFYLHSRLLERSASLSDEKGGGTMTALPIVETLADDISAYIPTNVISITDGQIFLQTALFHSGVRPAINVGLSVSRVGGSAQTKAVRAYAGRLRVELAQYRELEVFARFGSDLDATTQMQLTRGEQLIELLKQDQNSPMSMQEQAIIIYLYVSGLMDAIPPETVYGFKLEFLDYLQLKQLALLDRIAKSKEIDEQSISMIEKAYESFMEQRDERAKAEAAMNDQ